ncbi:hypothetical protein BH10ACT1_BH10ACT1_42610 [soil metagenome]
MEYGTHQMQRLMAAGAARRASVRPSTHPWSIGTGIGVNAVKPCGFVATTKLADDTGHRQPEEAPL